jgi:pyruvyl transferase EpsI
MKLPSVPRAFLFLAADYGNIGDLAITAAQMRFLSRTLPGHQVVPVPISATREVIGSIRRQVAPDDLVTTIGGGNMGSMYREIEELRQLVIRSFPDNRIVCFPQTLDQDDSKSSRRALDRITRVYSVHPDLYVFARESVSFDLLRSMFAVHASVEVGLVPDIVLSANADELGAKGCATPRGALLCLRNDRERSLCVDDQATLRLALVEAGLEIEITDTHTGGSRLAPELCAQLLADKLSQFRAAQLVVTDRLHGMILSFLAGTPCLVLPSSNHKISQTWADWLKNQSLLTFIKVDRFDDLPVVLEELLIRERGDTHSSRISELHYSKLRDALTAPNTSFLKPEIRTS